MKNLLLLMNLKYNQILKVVNQLDTHKLKQHVLLIHSRKENLVLKKLMRNIKYYVNWLIKYKQKKINDHIYVILYISINYILYIE